MFPKSLGSQAPEIESEKKKKSVCQRLARWTSKITGIQSDGLEDESGNIRLSAGFELSPLVQSAHFSLRVSFHQRNFYFFVIDLMSL